MHSLSIEQFRIKVPNYEKKFVAFTVNRKTEIGIGVNCRPGINMRAKNTISISVEITHTSDGTHNFSSLMSEKYFLQAKFHQFVITKKNKKPGILNLFQLLKISFMHFQWER